MPEHPIHRLDDDVHQRVRFGILTLLTGVARADFALLKKELHLTDGNLGRHLETLATAGLVKLERTTEDNRPRTWIKITHRGRVALRREVKALRELIATLDTNLAGDNEAEPVTAAGRVENRTPHKP
jgi:DNA-binding MarR family transcriptional regulator